MPKIRLDQLLFDKGFCESREQALRVIMSGAVLVDDRPATKPGHKVEESVVIRVRERPKYVSRGGLKLEAALNQFEIDPSGWVCADLGASTGGFTDVLLQRGASRVYAVDVGYGQLHWRLRQDERVIVMERTNARYLGQLPEPVQLVTIDASFISLQLLLEPARHLLADGGLIVALIKPQFEAVRDNVGKGGVVRDEGIHRQVLSDMLMWSLDHGLSPQGLTPSPILGPKGNREFTLWIAPHLPPVDTEILLRQGLG